MRKLLPYKKGKRKSVDLKIPIPLVGGIQNTKIAEWQLNNLLTSGQRRSITIEDSVAADGDSRRGSKKAGSTISTIETRPQATLPARPISSPPVLAMPHPRRILPPEVSVLRREDLDKTELESGTSGDDKQDNDDVIVLWPHNWHEVPNYIQQEQILAGGITDANDPRTSSSEDSTHIYMSALQSPLVSDDQQPHDLSLNPLSSDDSHSTPRAQHLPLSPQPRLATKEQQQQPRRLILVGQQPPQPERQHQQHQRHRQQQQQQHEDISLEDLQQQVDMIQLQRVKERREWERREMEHRQREKEMLDKIQDTQKRLERALANNSNNNINNNNQNGTTTNTTTDSNNNTNRASFAHHRNIIREQPMQQQGDDVDDNDTPPGSLHYYYYYPYARTQQRRQQPRPRPQRRSSAPGSPTESDYQSVMEEVVGATHQQQHDEDDDDNDLEEDNATPAMSHPRRRRRSYMAEDLLPYATFPSHVRRPPPHTFMPPHTAAVHGGGGMPPPHLMMYDDWAPWAPQPFHPRHHRFPSSIATTPSTTYPESFQDEYFPYPYPFLRPPSSSTRMHQRAAGAAPVPMYHHHRPTDGPPPPSMGYR